jgi:hypothetical protein
VAALSVEADLDFTMTLPGSDRREVTGRLHGSGSDLELEISDPTVFASRRDAGFVHGLAEALARRGLALTVTSPTGPVLTLGSTRSSWVQRWITGSRHLRLASAGALWSVARSRNQAAVLPGSELAPPATPVPLAPTFLRRPRPPVTTTHDPRGGGSPRLVLAPSDVRPERVVFPLRAGVTQVGSAEECDIVLPGLDRFHAVVRHDDADEFVVVRLGSPGGARVNGEPVAARTLRTGSRVDLGGWTLTFYREEYADHGRPYGGRQGGEIGHQRPQPPRPMTART